MTKQYQLGIVGYGGMADWHHRHLVQVPQVIPYAAYDIDPERNEVAEQNGLITYPDLDSFLADEAIDIVLISCPNNFHADYSIRAMEAGKHVICEKPVTMNSEEMARVIEAKNRTGMHFSAHQNRRWDHDYLTVRDTLATDVLGEPFLIVSKVLGSRGIPDGWRTHVETGGGMMLDWGVHLLDQIALLVPENIKSVDCHMYHTYHDNVDDGFIVRFTFDSGLIAIVEVDTNAFVSEPRWIVRGLTGSMVIENWNVEGKIVRAKDRNVVWEDEILYTAAGPTKTMAPRTSFSEEVLPLEISEGDWLDFYRNFIGVLDGTDEPFVTPEQSYYILRLMEACFLSHEENRTVDMADFEPHGFHIPT